MRRVLIAATPFALMACHATPSVTATNASTAEVERRVAAAGGAAALSPGRWEGTVTIHDMQMTGMDPRMAAMMRQHLSQPQHIVSCLTPEQARNPHFFGDNGACRYDHFTMAGGAIDAVASCNGPTGQRTMTIKGTFSADAMHADAAVVSAGTQGLKMTMTTDARRTGACTGREDGE